MGPMWVSKIMPRLVLIMANVAQFWANSNTIVGFMLAAVHNQYILDHLGCHCDANMKIANGKPRLAQYGSAK
jgi:hypothetical protein